jgi:hypothetical protein
MGERKEGRKEGQKRGEPYQETDEGGNKGGDKKRRYMKYKIEEGRTTGKKEFSPQAGRRR